MADAASERGEFSIERERSSRARDKAAADPLRRDAGDPPSEAKLDDRALATSDRMSAYPDRIRRKYYVVEDTGRGGDAESRSSTARVYTDAKGEYLAFKDTGARISTRLDDANVARDMVAVAAHRGWETVTVRGSAAFRREAWLEASARDIEVRGYEPSAVDRVALGKRAAEFGRRQEIEGRSEAASPDRTGVPALDAGASALVVSRSGRDANLAGADVGRPALTPRGSAAQNGPGGSLSERFRTLDRRASMRDPALAAAHSQLALLERSLRDVFPTDARVRAVVLDAAREQVADHLGNGRTFRRAEIRVPDQAKHRSQDGREIEPSRQQRLERTRARDRGRE